MIFVQGIIGLCAMVFLIMAGVDYRGGQWFRTHWLGLTIRVALPLSMLALTGALVWFGDVGSPWSPSWRVTWAVAVMLGLYHGVYGLWAVLFDLDGDGDASAGLRGRLNLLTLGGCVFVALNWWANKGGPPMARSITAIASVGFLVGGAWPTGDDVLAPRYGGWASGLTAAIAKVLVIGLGLSGVYLLWTFDSASPFWR